jgi:hypothetical protein
VRFSTSLFLFFTLFVLTRFFAAPNSRISKRRRRRSGIFSSNSKNVVAPPPRLSKTSLPLIAVRCLSFLFFTSSFPDLLTIFRFSLRTVYRHRRPLESDGDALGRARADAAKAADPANGDPDHHLRGKTYGQGRRETATDEMAMARFKKRQHNLK